MSTVTFPAQLISDDVVANPTEVLKELDPYIVSLARRKLPSTITYSADLDADDLAQDSRIKLWLALQRIGISNPRAYVRCIVYSESINMVRRHKPAIFLDDDSDCEFFQDEGAQDPLNLLVQEEALGAFITRAVEAIRTLPPRQRHAMICSLKDQGEDAFLLLEALKKQNIDLDAAQWPEEKSDLHSMRSSLYQSRKKLRFLLSTSSSNQALLVSRSNEMDNDIIALQMYVNKAR